VNRMIPSTLAEMLARAEAEWAQRPAVADDFQELSYAEFYQSTMQLAGALLESGVKPGDRVGLLLKKDLSQARAIFACACIGAIFVPLNPQLKAAQIRYILDTAGASFLLCQHDVMKRLVPHPGQEIHLSIELIESGKIEPSQIKLPTTQPTDLAALLFTSGSTGNPKGVMLSQQNLVAGARIVCEYLELTAADRLLAALPFSFDYGLNQLIAGIYCGARVRLFEFIFGTQIVQCLHKDRISCLAGVPTLWGILTTSTPKFSSQSLPQLRLLTNSGGALDLQTIDRLRQAQPDANLILMYGLTEAFRSTYVPVEQLATHQDSIGWAIPETEVFLVDESNQTCPVGAKGMLVHSGPTVALGYWKNPEATAKVFRPDPREPDGVGTVVYSGDYATQLEDGSFRFIGRKDTLIKSSGFRISPTEVEQVLLTHSAVQSAAVIGLPDQLLGQRVHAICVGGTDDETATLLRFAAQSLASHQLPRSVEWVTQLPTTSHGKVDYTRLVKERTL
jgi:amino acid adenylation domain-containing protein